MSRGGCTVGILLPDLRSGGAERLHINLADYWVRKGLAVNFLLRQRRGELLDALPERVVVHSFDVPRVRGALLPLVAYLRSTPPHALLAAMWPLTVIAPFAARLAGYGGNVVISEHAPQSLSYAAHGSMHNALMKATMRVGYRLAHARVGVSSGVADDMARLAGMGRARFSVIYNPAATGQVLKAGYAIPPALAGRNGPILLSVGTLKAVKRHDIMIRAFAQLPLPEATLCILGAGDERAALEVLISSLGLQDRVVLAGYQADPAPWYAHADLFVLSSDHEGFGNVIVEALEHGLPVVSTNCPAGPREILDDGRYGTLVPVGDVDALARAMADALSRGHDHSALRLRAQDFSLNKAADAYLNLLLPGWRGAVA